MTAFRVVIAVAGLLIVSMGTSAAARRAPSIERAPVVVATVQPDCHIEITWPRTTRSYILERRYESEDLFHRLADVDRGVSSFVDTTVRPNLDVAYRLVPKALRYLQEVGPEALTRVTFPAPPKPELRRIAMDSVTVTVHAWNPFARSVIIERRIGGVYAEVGRIQNPGESFRDGGLSPDRYHRYRARYLGSVVSGPSSPPDSILMQLPTPGQPEATSLNDHTVHLSWSSATEFPCAHQVEKRTGTSVSLFDLDKSTTEWTDTEVASDVISVYRVRAVSGRDSGEFSTATSVLIGLRPVSELGCDPVHDLTVSLHWTPAAVAATRYAVERSVDNSAFDPIAELRDSRVEYVDTTVARGHAYVYRVTSYARDGSSVSSEEAIENIPALLFGMVEVTDTIAGSHFYIDALEVTVDQYLAFCHDTGREPPADPGFAGLLDYWGKATTLPAVNVSWLDAIEFCNWRSRSLGLEPVYDSAMAVIPAAHGYRLPSREEFALAYELSQPSDVNFLGLGDGWDTVALAPQRIVNDRLYHMRGNVWEWVNDAVAGDARAVCGGAYCTPTAVIVGIPEFCYLPHYTSPSVGIRCVLNSPG